MIMTNAEILHKVRMQKGDLKYISILAQLNGCSSKDIENILTDAGWSRGSDGWTNSKPLFSGKESKPASGDVVIKKSVVIEKEKVMKVSKEKKKEMAEFYVTHPDITYEQLGKKFGCSKWIAAEAVRTFRDAIGVGKCNKAVSPIVAKEPANVIAEQMKKPEVVSVPTKVDALIIADPKQKELLKMSLDSMIDQKTKELADLCAVRDSIFPGSVEFTKKSGKTLLVD